MKMIFPSKWYPFLKHKQHFFVIYVCTVLKMI